MGKSTIDLIWSNYTGLESIIDFSVDDYLLTSDHLPIKIQFKGRKQLPLQSLEHKPNQISNICKPVISSDLNQINIFHEKLEEAFTLNEATFENFIQNIISSATISKVMTFKTKKELPIKNKPWFDKECSLLKKEVRKSLRQVKKKHNNSNYTAFVSKKKMYLTLIKNKKKQYLNNITNKLENINNPTQFWTTIRYIRNKNNQENHTIDIKRWEKHYRDYYVPSTIPSLNFHDALFPYLDEPISMSELKNSIRKLKNQKSPGPDKICNEIWKLLPQSILQIMLKVINEIFNSEKIPPSLCESKITLIHKKGDKDDENNYRGIALMNTLTKIFTSIIANRLNTWVESYNLLPESQAGFRSKRSCIDNIFTLMAITQIYMNKQNKKIYAIFVDLKKAFDSVDHNLLWNKLYRRGLSGKITRILKRIYDLAYVIINIQNQQSNPIKITKGVLQGDSISPLLFALFIADIEDEFKKQNLTGLAINHITDILMLAYADDLVIFADSPKDINRKLKALENYCAMNKLSINTGKTKIVCFHKGGSKPFISSFACANGTVDLTPSYDYLGVNFSSSGVFRKYTAAAIQKTNIASGNVRQILSSGKVSSWSTKIKLYETVVLPTLLYAAEVWALRYCDEIETCQVKFFKSIMYWPRNTPNYMVRLETGTFKLSVAVLKQTLNWWVKILKMNNNRFPKICFLKLKDLDVRTSNNPKYNWATQLKNFLAISGFQRLWDNQSPLEIENHIDDILNAYKTILNNEDKLRAENSTYSPFYHQIKLLEGAEEYLMYYMPIHILRVFSQIRVSNRDRLAVFIKGYKYNIDMTVCCSLCNLQITEDLYHIFF